MRLVKTLMVGKIFSKNSRLPLIPVVFVGGVIALLVLSQSNKVKENEGQKILPSRALDLALQKELVLKIDKAMVVYPKEGWEAAWELLEEVRWGCKEGGCDPEVFFNKSLDSLATTLTDTREFSYAGSAIGILSSTNWELADLDQDQENEIVVLQRDALNTEHTTLKVIDLGEDQRITSYILNLGYFSSPNSNGGLPKPLKILDITGDSSPEIILFLTPGRNGAHLFVFQYSKNKLRLILQEDDLLYPEYTFTDADGDESLEIALDGYDPKSGKRIKKVLNLDSQNGV